MFRASPPENVQDMELRCFVKELPNLSVAEDGILRRSRVEDPGSVQMIVPRDLTSRVLQILHDDLGYFVTAKISTRVKDEFFWRTCLWT